jgi:hypothetical protein
MLASAVKWSGSITYTRSTINGSTCYQPTSYKHKLKVLDSRFVLTSLNAAGGGAGYGYDLTTGINGTYSTGIKTLSKSNPTSGTWYSKSLSNTRYTFVRGLSSVNTYGTFMYYCSNETGQSIRTSPEFDVVLSD